MYKYLTIVVFTILLQACGSKAVQLTTHYSSSAALNPDINNQPSPLVVNCYQLKSIAIFQDADFFSLYNNAKSTLQADLLSTEQIEIKPAQQLISSQDLLPGTNYIAFIGAFRDIDSAVWQTYIPVGSIKKATLNVSLGPEVIEIKK